MAKRPYRDDFDQGEFSRDILDIIPERYDYDEDSQEARSGSRFRTIITLVVAVAAVGGIVAAGWKLVGGRHGLATGGGVPEIRAENQPIKVRPEDRGGMQVPNQDKLVYRSMEQEGDVQGGAGQGGKVERLLAPPEEPRPPSSRPDTPVAAAPPAPALAAGNEPPPPQSTALPQVSQAPLPPAPSQADTRKFSDIMKEPETASPSKPTEHKAQPESKPVAAKPAEPKPVEVKPAPQPAPQPAVQAAPPTPPAAAPQATPKRTASLAGGDYVVQLGAVRSADAADKEWSRILHANSDLLTGLNPDVVRVDLPGKGTFWRVRAGSLSDQAARQLCQQLTARNQGCIVAHK